MRALGRAGTSKRILACQRCRDRKQKCDNARPRCTHCVKADRDCIPQKKNRLSQVDTDALLRRLSVLEETVQRSRDDENIQDRDGADVSGDASTPVESAIIEQHTSPAAPWLAEAPMQDRHAAAATFVHQPVVPAAPSPLPVAAAPAQEPINLLSREDAASYYDAYLSYVQPQYPFIAKRKLDDLCRSWSPRASSSSGSTGNNTFDTCVVYLVFAVGALIYDDKSRETPSRAERLYAYAETTYVPEVMRSRNLIDQTTVLLLLTMWDLHSPSSYAIIQHTSAAVRTAITVGLHRRRTAPRGVDDGQHVTEQMRKRIWWSCYSLDRCVAMTFGHPVSISDNSISTEMFDNVTEACATPPNVEPEDVSIAYFLLLGRKIQSRIIETFSDPVLAKSAQQDIDRIRSQFFQELQEWQASIPRRDDRPGYGGQNWFLMVAYYSVLGLASGLNDNFSQAIGANTAVACCNACITFQTISRSKKIAPSWMAVLSQFQAGVTILYSFWAAPPELQTEEFDPSYAARGLRVCSNNLVLLAEKWTEAEVYRDIFELLSKAVPLANNQPSMVNKRLSSSDIRTLGELLRQIRELGVHLRTISMADEILRAQSPTRTDRRFVQTSPPSEHQSSQMFEMGTSTIEHAERLLSLGGWSSQPGQSGSGLELYQPVLEYGAFGDPWFDSMTYNYP